MALSIEQLLGEKRTDQETAYSQFVSLLADMVDNYLSRKKFIAVRKPHIDADRYVRRQMQIEEANEMNNELTAQLLGTSNFVQIA